MKNIPLDVSYKKVSNEFLFKLNGLAVNAFFGNF